MKTPDNIDALLAGLLNDSKPAPAVGSVFDADDRAFMEHIIASTSAGSHGVFVVIHPDERMQYMLLNVNRASGIALLAKVMQRFAELMGEGDGI